ncbi:arginine--tRNA ligase [candidate division WOR-3 bacterium]|nr:arginine--tRNA ligase [candidate division WOR-3 bacterium]
MIRDDIRKVLEDLFPGEEIVVDYVPEGKEGDYYTNLAFKVAAREGKDPQDVARSIAERIKGPMIDRVTVLPPAFINFTLRKEYLYDRLRKKMALDIGGGKRILIEYVSANPTGPINVVSARAAAVGDSLIRLLRKTGYKAEAEYYVNDTGRQADLLAESVSQRMIEIKGGQGKIPEDGYHGEYVMDLAREIITRGLDGIDAIREYSIEYFVRDHQEVMRDFGVVFDVWTRESDIYRGAYVARVLETLRSKGKTYTEDGATFFRTTEFGDDKDRVIVTKDGRNTYLLPDIAYHLHKMERKYDLLVDIWGPDHQGHIKGIAGGLQALGYPAQALRVLIIQEVKIKEHGELMSMSKRAGKFAALADLLGRVPRDVIRFFFLMRSSSQPLDFDLDLALRQSDENPVYYVQYAHARIKSIIAYAAEGGIALPEEADMSLLEEKEEFDLIKDILKFEEILHDAVRNLEPYQITYYLIDLAHDFHLFYQKHRVVGEDRKLSQARLYLIERTAITIKDGLELLGVSCPEKM